MSGDSSKLHEMTKAPRRLAQSGGVREPHALRRHPSPRPQHPNETPRDGKIRTSCMIRGVCAAKRSPSWQDLRAVYSQTAICRAFRMHGAHILPKPAHFGCMARESCHELAVFPSEAPSEMHEAKKLPRIDTRERTAQEYCHCQSGQERITAQSCHRRTPVERISRAFCHRRVPGNASGRNLAIARRPPTNQ